MNIIWFRRDLRVVDNRVLAQAKGETLPIFIFDKTLLQEFPKKDRRIAFILFFLKKLKRDLKSKGLDLAVFYGDVEDVFSYIAKKKKIDTIYASFDSDSYSLRRDAKISQSYNLTLVNDNFLFLPKEVTKADNTAYKVFTPFYKSIKHLIEPIASCQYFVEESSSLTDFFYEKLIVVDKKITFKDLELHSIDKEEFSLEEYLKNDPRTLLKDFSSKVANYKDDRDFLDLDATSKLGVHLRFGTIGIREVTRFFLNLGAHEFVRQLIWREFFNSLLVNFPHSESGNFLDISPRYENDKKKFQMWCQGKTGVPLVDAGMRELNSTGYMHNRARMVVASFLTKNLFIDWRWGEQYFKETLIDYEACSNIGSWQWAASTGADAVPYFRVFNPYLQSKKFDNQCRYIKSWVRELESEKSSDIHKEEYLLQKNIKGYPKPIVKQKESKEKFLREFRG